jgi:hypothetical protein
MIDVPQLEVQPNNHQHVPLAHDQLADDHNTDRFARSDRSPYDTLHSVGVTAYGNVDRE